MRFIPTGAIEFIFFLCSSPLRSLSLQFLYTVSEPSIAKGLDLSLVLNILADLKI